MNNISETKLRILDAAENQFALNGYHATSLRKITGKAKVNLAAVNYHFGSKEALLRAVIERRLIPLNKTRIEAIKAVCDAAASKGKKPEVRGVMRAFIEPTLRFRDSGPGARDFILLVGRSILETDETVRKIFMTLITPLLKVFTGALKEAAPQMPDALLVWRVNFAVGSLAHTLRLCGMEELPEPIKHNANEDIESLIEMLVDFVSTGFESK